MMAQAMGMNQLRMLHREMKTTKAIQRKVVLDFKKGDEEEEKLPVVPAGLDPLNPELWAIPNLLLPNLLWP
jgi:hypothetical protein